MYEHNARGIDERLEKEIVTAPALVSAVEISVCCWRVLLLCPES